MLDQADVKSSALVYVFGILAVLFGIGALIAFFRSSESEEQGAQDTLDAYLNHMQQWLDDENRPLLELPPEDPRRRLARTRTLEVLRRLDPEGKRSVMRFLKEHGLIRGHQAIVFLGGANLSHAHLAGMNLTNAKLVSVNFSDADLTGAEFSALTWTGGDHLRAIERGEPDNLFARPCEISILSSANLSNAILRKVRAAGCYLDHANFEGADLEMADLRGADLRWARNLTQKQVDQAYGSYRHERMPDTMLPDGLKVPAAWSMPIHEQREDKERSPSVIRRLAQLLRLRN